ncbi:uncharacterized protein YkwD [Deinobacterium chartae]|uniref:Uncharacterized protein YkwD n=1 Tax=Deinobacterium chartae TaxID=521158 RepID=A0A841I219_9DEIO|nr:CAP domain-containing protein [Deinobacterium chartae]MBB6099024.1 uncharacterized protein YkwD [Deinobacterium chartae]
MRWTFPALLALTLAACDLLPQNAGDNPFPSSTGTAPERSAPPTDKEASEYERQVFELTNQARAQARTCGDEHFPAAPPLEWNATLARAAAAHARDMAEKGYFAHESPDGKTPFDRIRTAGYRFMSAGENLAAGTRTPQQTVQGWLRSPGHCAVLMNRTLRELGVAYLRAPRSEYRTYWVQNFGSRSPL